jgi:hypothetical protein
MNDNVACACHRDARWDVVNRSFSCSTFEILQTVLGHRSDGELIGCVLDDTTATVQWDRLVTSDRLSSTERALLHIARGCSIIERHGIRADHAGVVTEAIACAVDSAGRGMRRSATGRSDSENVS